MSLFIGKCSLLTGTPDKTIADPIIRLGPAPQN